MKHKLWKLVAVLCASALALAFAVAPAKAADVLESGTWGTCPWEITADGRLTVHPGTGAERDHDSYVYTSPWLEHNELITSVAFVSENGQKAIAPADSSYLFAGLYKAKSIDCSGLDTSGATNMANMFATRYSYAFLEWYPSSLVSVNLAGFDTSNVTDMSRMFSYDEALTSLDLSGFDTSNVTDMGEMFVHCTGLASIDLSGFTTQDGVNASNIFSECYALKSLKIGAGFTLGEDAWTGLKGLWLAASDGNVYTSAELVSRGVADTYTLNSVASGIWGSCAWDIDTAGTLTVHPGTGAEQESSWGMFESPWSSYSAYITKVVFAEEGGQKVIAPANSRSLLASLYKVESIDLSGLDTSNVTDMNALFSGCVALATLDLSGFDTRKVTDMGSMFSGCASLVSLDLTSFDTANVTSMSYMFGTFTNGPLWVIDELPTYVSCDSLTYLDISSFDTTNVTDMGNMFTGLTALQTFKVGAKFVPPTGTTLSGTAWSVPDGAWIAASDGATYFGENLAFRGVADTYTRDNSVYTVGTWGTCPWEIGNDGTLTVHPGTGENTATSESPLLPDAVVGKSPWGAYSDHITSIVFVQENGQKAIAPKICASLFANLQNVVSIDLSGLDTSGVTNMSFMFSAGSQFTSSLERVNLTGIDTSNVTNMRGMFQGCTKLASLDVSGFNTSKVTDMSRMFGGYFAGGGEGGIDEEAGGCESLVSLDVSNFDTSHVTNMANMFYGCASLTSLDLSNFNTSNVTDMSVMFKNCASLTSLDLSNFDTSRVTSFCAYQSSGMSDYYEGLFEGCKSLVSLDVSSFVTSGVDVMDRMFSGCASLRELDLAGWDTSNVRTMVYMFQGCSSLKTIYVSELWSLESIVESYSLFKDAGTRNMFGTESYWNVDAQVSGYCASLVGGNGTVFDAEHTDGEYACIDSAEAPGYFTYKAASGPVVVKTGWQQENGGWYYYEADGTLRRDAWVEGDGCWYFVDGSGRAKTEDWVNYDGAWYYFGADGKAVTDGWVKYDGAWYYFGADGKAKTEDWVKYNGAWYYFGADGKCVTETWVRYNGAWYYFGADGKCQTSSWVKYNGAYYYVGADGKAVANSWIKHNGAYYYLDANGNPRVNDWATYNGKFYYLGSNGQPIVNTSIVISGTRYYFDGTGAYYRSEAA